MQSQKQKGELLGEVKGKTISWTIKAVTPDGINIDSNDEGQFSGKWNGGHVETVDVWLKADGTTPWSVKGFQATPEGDVVAFTGSGNGKLAGQGKGTWWGECTMMTGSPRLAWLNGKKVWVEGQGNQISKEFWIKLYAIK